jgi:hypothetical protein
MYDATSRKDIRRAEKELAAAAEASARFVRVAMSTTSGRKWFHSLLASCGVFTIDPTFEPNRDYFFLGIRNVGMRIFAELQTACPDLYILMENEAHDRPSNPATVSPVPDATVYPDSGDAPDDTAPSELTGSPSAGWNFAPSDELARALASRRNRTQ